MPNTTAALAKYTVVDTRMFTYIAQVQPTVSGILESGWLSYIYIHCFRLERKTVLHQTCLMTAAEGAQPEQVSAEIVALSLHQH
jgi:hypothetical protein